MEKQCTKCKQVLPGTSTTCVRCLGTSFVYSYEDQENREVVSRFCIYCGETVIKNAKFCAYCGKELPLENNDARANTPASTYDGIEKSNPKKENWKAWGDGPDSNGDGFKTALGNAENKDSGIEWKVPVIAFGLVAILLFSIFQGSNQSDIELDVPMSSIDNPDTIDENSTADVKPNTDCRKVGKGSSFSELSDCRDEISTDNNETQKNVESPNSSNESTASIEDLIRNGLQANCDSLPINFNSLRFQNRGETFNSYGMPLELYSLGNATLTFFQDGSSSRVGYAEQETYAILNSWQCIFPFDVP